MERVFALVDIGSLSPTFTTYASSGVGGLVSVVVKNAFILAGVLSFILLIAGGFGIITGAGGGDPKKMEGAKGTMTAAVVGLLLVVGSVLIVRIISVITGVDILSPKLP